jgi:carboxymethylenebutenolidase
MKPRARSVVVLHEAFGVRSPMSNILEVCARLDNEGFAALAPDLFGGRTAASVDEALALMRTLSPEDARRAIDAAFRAARRQPWPRAVVLGFCMGGALAFRTALERDDVAGAVVFYGTPRGELERLAVPVLGHFALRDRFVSLPDVREAEAQLIKAGKPVAFHYYDAEHAFMNEKLPAFSPAPAALAWQRTLDFLRALEG